jgi:multiple sugar transport system permease protein
VVWLGESGYALAVMIFADVWKTGSVHGPASAGRLQVIPEDVYDAAKVDGATTWQRLPPHHAAAARRRRSSWR